MTEEYKPGNEVYTISVEEPIIRAGIKISTQVSGRYAEQTAHYLVQLARDFNESEERLRESKLEQKTE